MRDDVRFYGEAIEVGARVMCAYATATVQQVEENHGDDGAWALVTFEAEWGGLTVWKPCERLRRIRQP